MSRASSLSHLKHGQGKGDGRSPNSSPEDGQTRPRAELGLGTRSGSNRHRQIRPEDGVRQEDTKYLVGLMTSTIVEIKIGIEKDQPVYTYRCWPLHDFSPYLEERKTAE